MSSLKNWWALRQVFHQVKKTQRPCPLEPALQCESPDPNGPNATPSPQTIPLRTLDVFITLQQTMVNVNLRNSFWMVILHLGWFLASFGRFLLTFFETNVLVKMTGGQQPQSNFSHFEKLDPKNDDL